MAITETRRATGAGPSPTPKRRLPIQIANEARMIEATIDLLRVHPVDAVTSRMIAESSGTATNYISRYFGGRDGLLVAVAGELGRRINSQVRAEESLIGLDRPGNFMARIMGTPEVQMWFAVHRYLTSRGVGGIRPVGKPALVTSVEETIRLIFGLEGAYVPICANIFLTYVMGNAAFGEFLGTTDDDTEAAMATMATVVELLIERSARDSRR